MTSKQRQEQGFTLIELLVTMTLLVLVGAIFLVFFRSALFDYIDLQSDATSFTQLSTQEMRVANVVRGLTEINSATANDLSIYAYFFPSDTYASLVHYYVKQTNGVSQLLADVTPMTANPPIGTPITSQEVTYTIISNFYQPSGGSLFTYLSAGNTALSLPITDLTTIKGIQVNLATPLSAGGDQSVQVMVSLRNFKTNL